MQVVVALRFTSTRRQASASSASSPSTTSAVVELARTLFTRSFRVGAAAKDGLEELQIPGLGGIRREQEVRLVEQVCDGSVVADHEANGAGDGRTDPRGLQHAKVVLHRLAKALRARQAVERT